jgi:hypothetical protein
MFFRPSPYETPAPREVADEAWAGYAVAVYAAQVARREREASTAAATQGIA